MKYTVIGDGGFGTAIALVLHEREHDVTLWGRDENHLDELQAATQSSDFRKRARQTSFPSRASWLLENDPPLFVFSSNKPKIDVLGFRSRHCNAT